jgi:hypothetical protein
MRKFLLSVVLAATVKATVSPAQAFPMSARVDRPAGEVVQVRGFCGLGWHRGYYGECRPNGAPYLYAPYAVYGAPPPARCWWTATVYGQRMVCA